MERVFDQLDARFRVFSQDDLNNIEAKKNVGIVEHSQPGETAARNAPLFIATNCFQRTAEIFASARFHLDEYQRVVVTTDDVDLAPAAAAKIAEKNLVTATLQISTCQFLAVRTAPEMLRLR